MAAQLDLLAHCPRTPMPPSWRRSARVSDCGQYRTELRRWWGVGPLVAWLMLNPSRANGLIDDPTVLRIIGFTWRWGYDGLVVVNFYPYRASKPADLWQWCGGLPWWEGPERSVFDPYRRDAAHRNLDVVERAGRAAALRMVAFGGQARVRDLMWVENALEEFQQPSDSFADEALYCLGTTKSGAPLHPMARGRWRVSDDQSPLLWRAP